MGPPIPDIDPQEFPEEKLKPKIIIPEEEETAEVETDKVKIIKVTSYSNIETS